MRKRGKNFVIFKNKILQSTRFYSKTFGSWAAGSNSISVDKNMMECFKFADAFYLNISRFTYLNP
jgi:hypothetical protein